MLAPASLTELQNAVRDHVRVLAVGAQTKPRLTQVENCRLLSLGKLSGITEYQPSEYTFTALAGTPLREIKKTLAAQGQAMPFDPLLCHAGSTLGGATATGLAGPGRFRYGGIRDFLLGISYVDGAGQLIRAGSRVVKNTAGFDIPKLMVGSLGRYGILVELTLKVFPKFRGHISLQVVCANPSQAAERLIAGASSRWELVALDYQPAQKRLLLQLGGSLEAIGQIAKSIERRWPGEVRTLDAAEADTCWEAVRALKLPPVHDQSRATMCIVQIVLTPTQVPILEEQLSQIDGLHSHYSVGGNVATLSCQQPEGLLSLNAVLIKLQLQGLVLQGAELPLWLGVRPQRAIDRALQFALDPQHRFPSLESPTP